MLIIALTITNPPPELATRKITHSRHKGARLHTRNTSETGSLVDPPPRRPPPSPPPPPPPAVVIVVAVAVAAAVAHFGSVTSVVVPSHSHVMSN